MASFFPFASSSTKYSLTQDAQGVSDERVNLEITVTPSASAFYAGEIFSVTITFRNTRKPVPGALHPDTPTTATVTPTADSQNTAFSSIRQLPSLHQSSNGSSIPPQRRRQVGLKVDEVPLGQNATAGPSRIETPLGTASHTPFPYSPGANPAHRANGWPSSPERDGPVNYRSPEGWGQKEYAGIGHEAGGHTRRTRSLALGKGTMSPQELVWALGGQPTPPPLPVRRGAPIPSHHPHSRKISITTGIPSPQSVSSSPPLRPPLTRLSSSTSEHNTASSSTSTSSFKDQTKIMSPKPTRQQIPHSRMPSYHNAYGASSLGLDTLPLPPPPAHPYVRAHPPSGSTMTILWAYAQLVGHFHPSNAYIPPDPLLPLRALLLHQPIGSGSLSTDSKTARGAFSFGTGAIGHSTQPSLTGSLFGLAKELVYGGSGGTLEEERKRVWNMKDLPVLETTRSLLGVDLQLKEDESKEFTYTLQLPLTLPPSHHGKAFRFSYVMAVSISVALPGDDHRQKVKTISIPIRVWANVTLAEPIKIYNVLRPVIQTRDEAMVEEGSIPSHVARRASASLHWNTHNSLKAYAAHLIDSSAGTSAPRREAPLSPSRLRIKLDHESTTEPSGLLNIPTAKRYFVQADDQLLDTDSNCGEAVEVLSRHSGKASYDITKDGAAIAVLTLIKTAYRLGETVLGVVMFNGLETGHVLKFSAFLESHEIIPESLSPTPDQSHHPALLRLHAEHRSAYAVSSARLSFALDIPSDATPAFALAAGEDGSQGGLEWRVRLNFIVALSRRRHRGVHLVPRTGTDDMDNKSYSASNTLIPLLPARGGKMSETKWQEMNTEVVECVVPVQVLAGNTAFVVRPTAWVI